MKLTLRCSDCKHYDDSSTELGEGDGQCRRNPPQVCIVMVPAQDQFTGRQMLAPQSFSTFPQVAGKTCWCGEWSRPLGVAN